MADVFGSVTSVGGEAAVCIRCGSAGHTTQQHDSGVVLPARPAPAASPRRARSRPRMRNVPTAAARTHAHTPHNAARRGTLQRHIEEAAPLCHNTGPADGGIKPYVPGRRVTTAAGGAVAKRERAPAATDLPERKMPQQAIVRRFDGGRRLPVLTQGWSGAPPVMTQRNPSVRDAAGGATVPALLRNGEIVDFEDDWSSQTEYAFVRARREQEHCCGFVERCHLRPFDLSVHPKSWENPSDRPNLEYREWPVDKDRMKTRRQFTLFDDNPRFSSAPPRKTLHWRLSGKDQSCPVLLTSARDAPGGGVVASAPLYGESQHAADRIAGFAPKAAPRAVLVCAR
eukprot:TRINITY_DN8993_c2_g2_i3.p1 TRINITY_DN8993_c2_g2~~TRINITY_DN8993_c2_g2_i3.p1  ORF type:complete len:378 (+),score=60.17 TRINITY_DN8993_c2_g2_i3:114-1136(+)